MPLGIRTLTSQTPKFWHRCMIMYRNFMVIVELCTLSQVANLFKTKLQDGAY